MVFPASSTRATSPDGAIQERPVTYSATYDDKLSLDDGMRSLGFMTASFGNGYDKGLFWGNWLSRFSLRWRGHVCTWLALSAACLFFFFLRILFFCVSSLSSLHFFPLASQHQGVYHKILAAAATLFSHHASPLFIDMHA
jgi:hypothetical protein